MQLAEWWVIRFTQKFGVIRTICCFKSNYPATLSGCRGDKIWSLVMTHVGGREDLDDVKTLIMQHTCLNYHHNHRHHHHHCHQQQHQHWHHHRATKPYVRGISRYHITSLQSEL